MKLIAFVLSLFLLRVPAGFCKKSDADEEIESARKALESRHKTQVLTYFFGQPKDASAVDAHAAIDLYNQGVEFFQKKEYDLARQVLEDSLGYDDKNPFAHELLGDIAYYEQKLPEAEKHYEDALKIRPRSDLHKKLEKLLKEKTVEANLATYDEEHFVIKYAGEDKGLEGFELQDLLRAAYREVSQDLGHYFHYKVVVLLYEDQQFRELSGAPHWSSGIYDGKIRLPAYKQGFTNKEIKKIIRHELTHAFIAEISEARCPAWLNEGLAEFEEAKVEAPDMRVFDAAIKTNALLPLASLFDQKQLLEIKDPLEVQLFYVEAYHLVDFLVKRYGMFKVKQMVQKFAEGKDSMEAVEAVLNLSPLELERLWRSSF